MKCPCCHKYLIVSERAEFFRLCTPLHKDTVTHTLCCGSLVTLRPVLISTDSGPHLTFRAEQRVSPGAKEETYEDEEEETERSEDHT